MKRRKLQSFRVTNQLKLSAPNGKKHATDVLDGEKIIYLAAQFPSKVSAEFVKRFTRTEDGVDGKNKRKAFALFESSFIESIEVGTVKRFRQIHAYLFGELYDFARQI